MKSKVIDMSVGSPTKHLLAFTFPLLIGNVFQQLYNMVDSLIVGNFVGANALAAVGTCGPLNFFFFSLSSGLAVGIGIIVAQYFGAKNDKMVRTTVSNSFSVLGVVSVVVTLSGYIFSKLLLRILQCPHVILAESVTYLRITTLGIIFTALYNGIASILRALGDSRTPLYFLIISSIINLVLDFVFVLACHWGVFGVGFATIIAQAVSGILCLIYAYYKNEYFHLSRKELHPNRIIIISSFKLGVPLAFQGTLISISVMALQGVVNSFGETIMASFTIVHRIESLIQQPYGSLGAAVTTFSGQNYGAKDLTRVKKGFHRATFIAFGFTAVIVPVFQIFAEHIIGWFIKDPEVIRIGAIALRLTSWFYLPLGMIYVPRAVLNGCGDTTFSMINGITEVICRIAFSQILIRFAGFTIFGKFIPVGFWGIWLTEGITWSITAVICLIRYRTGKWRTFELGKME